MASPVSAGQKTTMVAKRLLPTEEGFSEAGQILRDGGLVAFPTGIAHTAQPICAHTFRCPETVYGLGANALNEDAVNSIFTTKGRPLTGIPQVGLRNLLIYRPSPADPLIVHVPTLERAKSLAQLTPEVYWHLINVIDKSDIAAALELQGLHMFETLAGAFWPGPLTLVVKACEELPLLGRQTTSQPKPLYGATFVYWQIYKTSLVALITVVW
jgi:tRNA A37 threonylcarbamoyladenosine synthetase subunit TsaC/SUA5/YrdC